MYRLKFYLLFHCISSGLADSFALVTDKPMLTYSDSSIFPFVNISAARYGRNNLQYYTTTHIELAVNLDDNYLVEIVFYENVNNQYKRSFIELQFKLCTFVFKDPIFGAAIKRQITVDHCPLPKSFALVTDKPMLTYSDSSIFPFVNISAARYGRNNLQYYTTTHIELAVNLDDNYLVEIVFYENVNNQYKRSFIELQFKLCTFVFKDPIFGAAIKRQITVDHCPLPKGAYSLYNMTAAAEHLPRLPFSKGRIYMSLKIKSKPVLKGYCDMELKKTRQPKL